MKLFDDARAIIKEKRYVKISDKMMDVQANIVSLQKKSGRSILTCSCTNSSRFPDSICSSKIVFIGASLNENLYKEIENSINQVKKYKELNLPMNHSMVLDILEGIKKSI